MPVTNTVLPLGTILRDGFSLDGHDANEKPSENVQSNHDEDPSDDDNEDSSDDVEDSPDDDEPPLGKPSFFTCHETINQALIAQNEFVWILTAWNCMEKFTSIIMPWMIGL